MIGPELDGERKFLASGALAPALKAALAAQIERSLPGVDITKPLPPELFA